jgi:hypothetical protein
VVDVGFVDVLHAKIVNDQGEADWVPFVAPVSRAYFALSVACFVELFGEEVLGNDAGLREAVHSSSYFAENVAIYIHFVMEFVFLNDILWEEFSFHSEVFKTVHGGHQVEIFNVNCHKLCRWC